MKTTWVLIASASQARLFKAEKTPKELMLVEEFHHPQSRDKIADLVSDVQGRYRKSNGTPRSSYEEPTNPKKVEAERFAHELAVMLNEGRANNLYHQLVLVAPSHFQGLLNKCCNTHVKNLIIETIDKDYTKLKEHELPRYLNGKISLRRAA